MRFFCTRLLRPITLGFAVTGVAGAQQGAQPAQLTQFLREAIRLDATQMATVEHGTPVVRVLDTENKRDVAVFGIVSTAAPRASVVRYLQDFRVSLATPSRVRFGIFSDPAIAEDVQGLVIDKDDAGDARKCRPGNCTFKLPATEMRRIQQDVDWKARDIQSELSAYARRRLLTYVTDYRARGDSALVVYDDRGGVKAGDAFADLLADAPYVYQYAPALAAYLREYPRITLEGARDVIYWSEDAAPHLRRTLNVNHLVLYTPPGLPDLTILASKQIYAKHYFEAAFDLMSVIDKTGPSPGSYLVVVRRYRFDNLPSGGLLNIRSRVLNSLRDRMTDDLNREKARVERQ